MASPNAVILKNDPYNRHEEFSMKFRLIYDGELLSTTQRDTRAAHKHDIRRKLHPQLKELWRSNKFLREMKISVDPAQARNASRAPDGQTPWSDDGEFGQMAEVLADRYSRVGYRFVPLVREDLFLDCSVDILFLRRDPPGSILSAGDIDNRLKTFFDALRLPRHAAELGGALTPQEDEDPFYCLLEDDKLITHVSVETDTHLDVAQNANWVHLIVTVGIRPNYVTMFNLNFV